MIVLAVAGIVAAVGAFRSSPRAPEA